MSKKLTLVFILALATFLLQTQTAKAGQTLPSASQWIPQDAVISLELSATRPLLELLAGKRTIIALNSLPVYQQQISKPQFKEFLNIVKFLEATLQTDWRTGLAKLTGGGITFAVCPENTVLLIIDAEDEQMLERLHEIFLNISKSEAEKQGNPNRVVSKQYDDVTAWTFDGKEEHAIIGKRLILSNRPEGLKAVLELRSQNQIASLASKPGYQSAQREVMPGTVAKVFADLKLLMQLPGISKLLEQQRKNPLAALAFSGIVEAVHDSN
jgi:hypothetical protein